MKKLFELLETMDKDKIVAIGAQGGNGFVYIGEAGNKKLIEKCFANCLKKVENALANNKEKLENLFVEPVQLTAGYNATDLVTLRSKAEAISKTCSNVIGNMNYIDGYIEPEHREVVEVYHKEIDDCQAILVRGKESGGFWTKDEFDKKYKK